MYFNFFGRYTFRGFFYNVIAIYISYKPYIKMILINKYINCVKLNVLQRSKRNVFILFLFNVSTL